MSVAWPDGHRFAFTICDDTDWSTVANTAPVYDFLAGLGMRTTKLAWMLRGEGGSNEGDTCEDPIYRDWLLKLQAQGFEIGFHNATWASSSRDVTCRALDRFEELFGHPPRVHANHVDCADGLYVGDARLTDWRRVLYNLGTRGKGLQISRGDVEGDPLFWGDLCRDRVTYVRSFAFDRVNTLEIAPQMPYHDPLKPWVNFWFASSNASTPKYFARTFTDREVDRLISSGGLCVAYAHLAAGFFNGGGIEPRFQRVMERLAAAGGWFAPVSEILDYLRGNGSRADRALSPQQRRRLELRWLCDKYGKKLGV